MNKEIIKRIIFIATILIFLYIVFLIIKNYEKKGETNMPYKINKILVVSTVDSEKLDTNESLWNVNVGQANDVFIYIEKNGNTDRTIKKITLDNFNIDVKPQKGEISLLRPTGDLENLYQNSKEDIIDKSIEYLGSEIDEMKSLEVSNIGGMIGFRLFNKNLGTYTSNEGEEIIYDGSLLSKLGTTLSDIRFSINFDITITTDKDISYKGTVNLNLPVGNIIENGKDNLELTDFSNVIFKRI